MPKSANQKLKMLYLVRLFMEKTDENNYVTMPEILAYLESNDIKAERKSIYDDIEQLKLFGFDILNFKENRKYYYYLASRDFELAELKLLVDVVQASKFITEKKSNELIGKLEKQASHFQARELQRHVYVTSRAKTVNESIYYNVDAINQAINMNRQINFEYYEWNLKKQLVKKVNGDKDGISPWALTWDDENYYLIAYDSESKITKHYRVDKIRNIEITNDERVGKEEYKKLNLADYSKKVFSMFGGEEEQVTLEVKNNLIGVFLDRFGTDIMVVPKQNGCFTVHLKVMISDMFLSWIIGLGDGVKILSPDGVVEKMKSMAMRMMEIYS